MMCLVTVFSGDKTGAIAMDSPAGAYIKFPATENISHAKYCRHRWAKSTVDVLWHAVAALPILTTRNSATGSWKIR